AVDDGGWIYTSHPQESVVLVHDARGARVATIGGAGEGPGEFRTVDGIGLVGDTLWALDRRLYRITYFSPAGELLRSVRVPIDLGTDPVQFFGRAFRCGVRRVRKSALSYSAEEVRYGRGATASPQAPPR
ncbi:MAG TPA: hypothetical protein VMM12_00160, partial [Longimicrobiales bacterium]|nr:hypothetical protein [Longimicrobiales bacterium]